ncbi:NERD domain-containing protein [Sporosarcina sp. 179-K 3D1 HS]|uniref:NERD domain-containing protein n=1 Tax=Sporosarcina sp. 179-K 3D1 HS TaxID=3232169 RepID=UPI0039A1E7D7
MAQLVKLLDYISRYEHDLARYPTQFIRLKKYQWDRMKRLWENGEDLTEWQRDKEKVETDVEPEETRWFSPLLRIFGKNRTSEEEEVQEVSAEDEDQFGFTPNIIYNPTNLPQLRRLYLDQLFQFQIKWASSTLMDKSKVDPRYMRDTLLRSFAQDLPDSFLLFYYPILVIKKAPVELDILLVTPIECICITVLEREELAAFIGSGDKFWTKKLRDQESKVLNPMIALTRMEKIVSGIFKANDIDFPIKKYVISRNGYIDYPGSAYDVQMVDRRNYAEWFAAIGKSSVPMKHNQFKAAQALLDIGQTTAMSKLVEMEEDLTEL